MRSIASIAEAARRRIDLFDQAGGGEYGFEPKARVTPAYSEFEARITYHTIAGENVARWIYDWSEVRRAADGTVSVLDGGRSGSEATDTGAYNRFEDGNTTQRGGTTGDGVDQTSDDYQATEFRLQPIGGGSLTTGASANNITVLMREERTADGETVYSFGAMNAHDGACSDE